MNDNLATEKELVERAAYECKMTTAALFLAARRSEKETGRKTYKMIQASKRPLHRYKCGLVLVVNY